MDEALKQRIERAKELLRTVRHAALATVNEDGSPHNTPFFFAYDDNLEHVLWGSNPDSVHSQNVARTGQIFVVLYDAFERGGLFIRADGAHITEGAELETALAAFNERRELMDKVPVPLDYYASGATQALYMASIRHLWVNISDKDANGLVIRDRRYEITKEDLLA